MLPDTNFRNEAARQMEDYGNFYSLDKELHHNRMYKENLTRGLIAPHTHGKKSHRYQRRHSVDVLDKSMVVIDKDSLKHRLSASSSVNSIIDHVQEEEEKDEVGRVAGWAVNFDKLLRDISGLRVFTEFLRKEFSEENIIFWTTVEKYKQITSQEMRNVKAKDIFDKHLCVHALEPVNIDNVARQQADSQLDIPTLQIFDVAQHQIHQLMKQDSYARFLKSELYKTYLLKEMEGKPLDNPKERNRNGKEADKKDKDSKKKIIGEENEDKEKRRRSLLPWRQKASKSSMKSSSDTEAKRSKGKEKVQESQPWNLSKNTPISGSKEVIIKKQVLFSMDLPNKKSIDVKAKSNRMIRVVLKPILHKYGFKMDSIEIYMSGHTAVLDLEGLVSSMDNQRVVVVSKGDCPGYQRRRSSLLEFIEKRVHRKCSKESCVDKDVIKGHIGTVEEQSQKTPKQCWMLIDQKLLLGTENEDMWHHLRNASSMSINDQLGMYVQDQELSELCGRVNDRPLDGSVPPMIMRDFCESTSVKRPADMMASETDDLVQPRNKYIAYTRKRTLQFSKN